MKQLYCLFKCDKCKVETNIAGDVDLPKLNWRSVTLGNHMVFHLCSKCSIELIDWLATSNFSPKQYQDLGDDKCTTEKKQHESQDIGRTG